MSVVTMIYLSLLFKKTKRFIILIFLQAINVLSSQDVGPSVKPWQDSCLVPYWWGPWLRRKRSAMSYYEFTKDLDASKAFEVGVNRTISAYFVYLCKVLSSILLHNLFSSEHQCGFLSQVMGLEIGHMTLTPALCS